MAHCAETDGVSTADTSDDDAHTLIAGEAAGACPARVTGSNSAAEPSPLRLTSRCRRLLRAVAFGLLPIAAMLIAAAIGYLKFKDSSLRCADAWRVESVQAAKDGAAAILSYRPDTADKDLAAAENRLTGSFKDSYTSLTRDVVIPAAKQRQISASASVPAAASVSATDHDAVVMVFVNQTTVSGTQAPTGTSSTVRVTLQRSGRDWLISAFDPI